MMSSCPSDSELLSLFDSGISEENRETLEKHLDSCEECRRRLDELEKNPSGSLLAGLRSLETPKSVSEESTTSLPDVKLIQIDAYRIVRKIGEGGMGAVYEVFDEQLHRPAALKLLRSTNLHNPKAKERFEREKRLVGQLRHPHIVESYYAGFFNESPFLVTELLNGENLKDYVEKNSPLSVDVASDMVATIAEALKYAHLQGVIHRDIKPSNVFLTKNGIVKILDFGLGKFFEDEQSPTQTSESNIMGSPEFVAPEQIRNSQKAGPESDVYSLGCLFYYLLCGRPPFAGEKYQTIPELISAHLVDIPEDVRKNRSDVPESVAGLIGGMLEKIPENRPTCPEIVDALSGLRPFRAKKPANRSFLKYVVSASALLLLVGLLLLLSSRSSTPENAVPPAVTENPAPYEIPLDDPNNTVSDLPVQRVRIDIDKTGAAKVRLEKVAGVPVRDFEGTFIEQKLFPVLRLWKGAEQERFVFDFRFGDIDIEKPDVYQRPLLFLKKFGSPHFIWNQEKGSLDWNEPKARLDCDLFYLWLPLTVIVDFHDNFADVNDSLSISLAGGMVDNSDWSALVVAKRRSIAGVVGIKGEYPDNLEDDTNSFIEFTGTSPIERTLRLWDTPTVSSYYVRLEINVETESKETLVSVTRVELRTAHPGSASGL